MVRLRNRAIWTSSSPSDTSSEDKPTSKQGRHDKKAKKGRKGGNNNPSKQPLGPEIRTVTGGSDPNTIRKPPENYARMPPPPRPSGPPNTNRNNVRGQSDSTMMRDGRSGNNGVGQPSPRMGRDANRNQHKVMRPTSPPPPPPMATSPNGVQLHRGPVASHPRMALIDATTGAMGGEVQSGGQPQGNEKKRKAPLPPVSRRTLSKLLSQKRRAPPPPIMEVSDDECESSDTRESPVPPPMPPPPSQPHQQILPPQQHPQPLQELPQQIQEMLPEPVPQAAEPSADYDLEDIEGDYAVLTTRPEASPETGEAVLPPKEPQEEPESQHPGIMLQSGAFALEADPLSTGVLRQADGSISPPVSADAGVAFPPVTESQKSAEEIAALYSVSNKVARKSQDLDNRARLLDEIRQAAEKRAKKNVEIAEPERLLSPREKLLQELIEVSSLRQARRASGALLMRNEDGRGSKVFKTKEKEAKKKISEGFRSPLATGRPDSSAEQEAKAAQNNDDASSKVILLV